MKPIKKSKQQNTLTIHVTKKTNPKNDQDQGQALTNIDEERQTESEIIQGKDTPIDILIDTETGDPHTDHALDLQETRGTRGMTIRKHRGDTTIGVTVQKITDTNRMTK